MDIHSLSAYLSWLYEQSLIYLPNVLFAIVILVVGWFVAKLLRAGFRRALGRTHIDNAVSQFLTSIFYALLLTLVVLLALSKAGVPTTPFTAVLTGFVFGVSTSLKSSLSILASGIMIVSSRPFKVGEFVDIGGTAGAVESIGFIFCHLRTSDGREILVPNNLVLSKNITNFSNNEFRRNDFKVGIAYESDLDKAKNILQKMIDAESRILQIDGKMPIIRVAALSDSTVDILVRYWTTRTDFAETSWKINEETKKQFDANSIDIPYPKRTVYTYPHQR